MIDEIYDKIDWLNVWEGEGEIWLMECMRRWKMIYLMNEKEKGMDDWLNVWEREGEIWLMECMRRWKMIDLMNEKEKGMDD